jgi:hypothetical protein
MKELIDLQVAIRACKSRHEILSEMLKAQDLEEQDLLHYIEFETFNACEGYLLANKIKEIRTKRREIKDEMESLARAIPTVKDVNADGMTRMVLDRMDTRITKAIANQGKTNEGKEKVYVARKINVNGLIKKNK